MAHFAKIDNNNIVTKVIAAEDNLLDTFIDTTPGTWIQTSYNTYGGVHADGKTPLRKNFAGVGSVYDAVKDAFIYPKPYDSWTLNNTTCLWEAPVKYPSDAGVCDYSWNETDKSWDEVK
tara:strand:+ start:79 stop:435 length:357 start_codon:yes stop_codon:yes gene_type:complete